MTGRDDVPPAGGGPVPPRTHVVTRPAGRHDGFVDVLERAGIPVVSLPLLATTPVAPGPEGERLVDYAAEGGAFDWICFTSAAGVAAFAPLLGGRALPADMKVAAQGPATGRAAEEAFGRPPDLTAPGGVQEDFARRIVAAGSPSDSLLLPGAEARSGGLAAVLSAAGRRAVSLTVYETVRVVPDPHVVETFLSAGPGRYVFTLFSPSAVHALAAVLPRRFVAATRLAAFGPVTGRAVRALGLVPFDEAEGGTAEKFAARLASLADAAP